MYIKSLLDNAPNLVRNWVHYPKEINMLYKFLNHTSKKIKSIYLFSMPNFVQRIFVQYCENKMTSKNIDNIKKTPQNRVQFDMHSKDLDHDY